MSAGNATAQEVEEYNPALACDPSRARCLLVIERFDVSIGPNFGRRTLHGRFVAAGEAPGPEFPIPTGVSLYHTHPQLAFDGIHDRFLLVHEANSDLYGQLLDAATGARVGGAFVVSDAPTLQDGHRVAFDPQSERFLVVWHDEREWPEGRNVYGQIANADGTLHGSTSDTNFPISDPTGSEQQEPSIALDASNGRFFVVWQDDRTTAGEYDIFGQLVGADGSLVSTGSAENSLVSDVVGSNQMRPSVAYDPVRARFLVVWDDDRNVSVGTAGRDVYGQLVDADGSLLDTASNVNRLISGSSLDQTGPVAGYDIQGDRFFAVWEDDRNMFPPTSNWEDVLGDYVAPDGTAAGGVVEVASTSLFEMRPVSAYDGTGFVVAYHVEAFGSDLKAIGVDGTVLPLPEPGGVALALTALLVPSLLRVRCDLRS